ncbi:MAG: sodium/pantothenate symporter [Candidatus Methanomethylicia archaeon]
MERVIPVFEIIIAMIIYSVILILLGYMGYKVTSKRRVVDARGWLLEYFLGGRELTWLILMYTAVATIYSAGTFIGAPGLAYGGGYVWPFTVSFQHYSAFLMFFLAGIRYAILGKKLGWVSYLDFFRDRYESRIVHIFGALGILIFITAYIAPQFVAGARLFEAITGLPYWQMLLLFLLIVLIYTWIGGFRAVVYTDLFQGILMTIGAVIIWAAIIAIPGGFSQINETLLKTDPKLVTVTWATLPTAILGIFVFGLPTVALPHGMVRCMAYKSSKDMIMAAIISAFIVTLFSNSFQLWGAFTRAVVPGLKVADHAIPTLIATTLPGWVAGIMLVAPIAAMMSTVDSMLLVVATTAVKDMYITYVNPEASLERVKRITVIVSIIISIVVVFVAFYPPPYLEYLVMYALGGLNAVFWWPFIGGLYWKRANKYGAMASMVFGLPFYIVTDRFLRPYFLMLHAAIPTFFIVGIVYIVATLLTPKPPMSIIRKFWGK